MKVAIGSLSPVKISAVKRGFATMFPNVDFIFTSLLAESGVSNQPLSLEEIRQGAIGRMNNVKRLFSKADFYVALEGGVQSINNDLYNIGWVIIDDDTRRGQSQTLGFMLPPTVKDLILNMGMEQSHAVDRILSKTNTKLGTGTIGPFTRDAITYADWYTHAVIAALIPFVNAELYK